MKQDMLVGKIDDLPNVDCSDFIMNARKKVIFGPDEGDSRCWESHVMRLFVLDSFAVVPPHKHSWPHHVLFVGGCGKILLGNTRYEIEKGDWAYIPGNTIHSFWNTELDEPLHVICIVPPEGDINPLAHRDEDCGY